MNSKITIITVTYNAANELEKTILSVLQQKYQNIEYIIIDGGSTDGSVEIIKKYSDQIAYWVSEPDNGIYDAMNKGIKKATGEWINFMNAGDFFFHELTLQSIFLGNDYQEYDILYSDVIAFYPDDLFRLVPTQKLDNLKTHMPFCHQTAFVKTCLAKNNMFDTSFRIAADYKFFYSAFYTGKKFKKLPNCHAIFSVNGLSSTNIFWDEYKRINGYEIDLKEKILSWISKKTPLSIKIFLYRCLNNRAIINLQEEQRIFEENFSRKIKNYD